MDGDKFIFYIFLLYILHFLVLNIFFIIRTILKIFFNLFFLIISSSLFQIYKLHPFQSFYFNSFVTKKNIHQKFEVDYWGLSGKTFFRN